MECDKLLDGTCDGSCQAQLEACLHTGTVELSPSSEAELNTTDDMKLQEEVKKLTEKEMKQLSRLDSYRIKKSQAIKLCMSEPPLQREDLSSHMNQIQINQNLAKYQLNEALCDKQGFIIR